MDNLRRLAITILEEVEEHVTNHEKPFDEEPWYEIEDTIFDILDKHFRGGQNMIELDFGDDEDNEESD